MLVARFFDGVAGAAFLSVAGGTVGDMFPRNELAAPMMVCCVDSHHKSASLTEAVGIYCLAFHRSGNRSAGGGLYQFLHYMVSVQSM